MKKVFLRARRFAPALLSLLCVASLSFYLIIPAAAYSYSGTLYYYPVQWYDTTANVTDAYTFSVSGLPVQNNYVSYTQTGNAYRYGIKSFSTFLDGSTTTLEGLEAGEAVLFAVSFNVGVLNTIYDTYYVTENPTSDISCTFDVIGDTGLTGDIKGETYEIADTTFYIGDTTYKRPPYGLALTGTAEPDGDQVITNMTLDIGSSAVYSVRAQGTASYNRMYYACYNIVSARVVTYDPALSDSEVLISIADAVIQQNQILNQFLPDILAMVTLIYSRLGDVQATLDIMNQYCENIYDCVSSIDAYTQAIYRVINSYFSQVIQLLQDESQNIQEAIKLAEKELEEYLKPVIDYFNELEETTGESADSLPGHKSDLESWASDSTGISDDALSGLPAVVTILSGFSFLSQIIGLLTGAGVLAIVVKKGLS